MPVTKSANKALRVAIRRKAENDAIRAKVKSALKGTRISLTQKSNDISEKLQGLYKELDLAAKKHVIHKNKASRLKSRMALAVNQLSEKKPEAATKKSTK